MVMAKAFMLCGARSRVSGCCPEGTPRGEVSLQQLSPGRPNPASTNPTVSGASDPPLVLPSQVRPENHVSGKGTYGDKMVVEEVEMWGTDASEEKSNQCPCRDRRGCKTRAGCCDQGAIGKQESAWKLKIELLKLKKNQ